MGKNCFRMALTKLYLVLGTILLASSCGQDRSVSDYRTGQIEQELTKYKSLQGLYRGLAYQAESNKPFGILEVQLFASSVVDSDGLRSEPRAVLQSYVTLKVPGLNDIVISMENGYYLSSEQKLKTIVTGVRNEQNRTIQLEAARRGEDTLRGTLSVFGFPDTSLEFEIDRGAKMPDMKPEDFAKDNLPYVKPGEKILYTGSAFYTNGKIHRATLELRNNTVNSFGVMVDILSPLRGFTGIVDVATTAMRFNFSPMIWDSETKTLVGEDNRGGMERIVLKAECHLDLKAPADTETWNCIYTSTLGGILKEFVFSRKL